MENDMSISHKEEAKAGEVKHFTESADQHISSCNDNFRLTPERRSTKECFQYAIGEWRCLSLTLLVLICLVFASACSWFNPRIFRLSSSPLDRRNYNRTAYSDESLRMHLSVSVSSDGGVDGVISEASYCQLTYVFICSSLIILFYLIYLIECWNSSSWLRSHSAIVDWRKVYKWMETSRSLVPIVYWQVTCYHYAKEYEVDVKQPTTRKRGGQVRVDDGKYNQETVFENNSISKNLANQNEVSTAYNYLPIQNVRVLPSAYPYNLDAHFTGFHKSNRSSHCCHKIITASATQQLNTSKVGGIWDCSVVVGQLDVDHSVEISVRLQCLFADTQSRMEFDQQKQVFFSQYEDVDSYMETKQVVNLPGIGNLPSRLYVLPSSGRLPWFQRTTVVWIATFCLLSYPLRVWSFINTFQLDYVIRKVLGQPTLYQSDQAGMTLEYLNRFDVSVSGQHSVTADFDQPIGRHPNELPLSLANERDSDNNEAIVLSNREATSSMTIRADAGKAMWCSRCQAENKVKDEDDDDELLSLDIRYDEFISNSMPVNQVLSNKYVT